MAAAASAVSMPLSSLYTFFDELQKPLEKTLCDPGPCTSSAVLNQDLEAEKSKEGRPCEPSTSAILKPDLGTEKSQEGTPCNPSTSAILNPDKETEKSQEETPLDPCTSAILNQDLETLKAKWTADSLSYTAPETGLSYLQIAVAKGNLQIVTYLMQAGADVNYLAYKPNRYSKLSSLHIAVGLSKSAEVLKCLLEAGCDTEFHLLVNSDTGLNGLTPFHIAILYHDVQAFELLVKHKTVINAQTLGGLSPLHLAAIIDNDVMVHKLHDLNILRQVYAKNGATALYTAAQYGSLKVLNILLEKGDSVDKRTEGGSTPLHAAALNGSAAVVSALCNAGSDLEAIASLVDGNGKLLRKDKALKDATPLHMAIENGHIQCVETLLKNHANSQVLCRKTKKNENLSALHLAVIKDSEPIIRLLIKHGADLNAQNNVGMTPLFCAVMLKRIDIVKVLLQQEDIGVNKCITGTTTLYSPIAYAIEKELEDIAVLLIEHPAMSINQRIVWKDNKWLHRDVTPLHMGILVGLKKVVEALLKRGADVSLNMNFNDGEETNLTLMHNVARERRNSMMKMLFDAGAALDEQSSEGLTPLMIATEQPNIELTKFLLDHGVDVNKTDAIHNMTVLMMTVEDGFIQPTKILLNTKKCLLNLQDDEGLTALHTALQYGNDVVANLLIDFGADVNLKTIKVGNRDRVTPLILAIEYSTPRMVRRLLKKGAKVTSRFMRDFTPLHLAAQLNKVEMIKDLLRYGADINAKSTRDETPLHFALYFESLASAEVLIRRGAQLMSDGEVSTTVKGKAIHYAAYRGLTEIIDLLADFGAEIFARGKSDYERGIPALSFACKNHDADKTFECFKKLVLLGCDVGAVSRPSKSVAYYAIATDKVTSQVCENRLKLLLKYGAVVDSEDDKLNRVIEDIGQHPKPELLRLIIQAGVDITKEVGESKSKLISLFAERESVDCLTIVTALGGDINYQDKNGFSPVHFAVKNQDSPENLRFLVNCGADVNLRGSFECLEDATPLHVAAWYGTDEPVLSILMEAGIDFSAVCRMDSYDDRKARENVTALHVAAKRDESIAYDLAAHGCDPNARNSAGETALFIAMDGKLEAFKELMVAGCAVDIGTHQLITPLMEATRKEQKGIVQALIQAGCNVNAEGILAEVDDDSDGDDDDDGNFIADFTTLHLAVEKGFASIVKMLIEAGANFECRATRRGAEGYRPLHCAVIKSHGDVIDILAKAGCNINAQLHNGRSALHLAVKANKMDLTKQLINLGIDPTLTTQFNSMTASELSKDSELTSLLVAYEASWKYKNQQSQRKILKRRQSLHQRLSMKAIEDFSTHDFDTHGPTARVVENVTLEESGNSDL